jgi:hypothetical protein
MPPQTANVPPDTPNRVRHSFDKIIERLNVRWKLKLPSLHGTQETALEQADADHSLAKRCTGRIRYLCFRDCQLDEVIREFEDRGERLCSEWVWKPSQEEGTLPKLPVTKNFISTRPNIPRKHRKDLLNHLFELLDQEFQLARDSEVYSRTSYNSSHVASTGPEKETETTPSVSASRNSVLRTTEEQSAERAVNNIAEASSRTRRSEEAMKRKSSESEKVRSCARITLFPILSPS